MSRNDKMLLVIFCFLFITNKVVMCGKEFMLCNKPIMHLALGQIQEESK